MTIEITADSIDNYMVDPVTDFEAKLNGNPVTVIPLDRSEFGYKRCMLLLDSYVEGENSVTIQDRIRYVNKNNPDVVKYTVASRSTRTYKMNVNKYTTIESADAIKESFIPPHEEIVRYPLGNGPGEYSCLHGDYAIDLDTYDLFFRELTSPIKPYVIDENDNLICYCTNKIDRTGVLRDTSTKFQVSIDTPITAPGTYYIIFPTAGNFRFFHPTGKYYNAYHFGNFKIGPYVVTGLGNEELPEVAAEVKWQSPLEFQTDHLPDTISLQITNAATTGIHKNSANSYSTTISCGDNQTAVTSMFASDGDRINIVLPAGWYTGAGEYTLSLSSPSEIIEALADDGARLVFAEGQTVETAFTVSVPELPESLDFYVRSAGATAYEIADGETVNVRLMHADQSLGMKIFVRWTPEEAAAPIRAKAAAEFAEHDGDVEISTPGRLEYYSTRGGVTSPVKAINFTLAAGDDDTTTGVDTPEILSIPLEEGLYDLRGVLVGEHPAAGLYIRRLSDGTARKVIVR